MGALGVLVILGIAFAVSTDRRAALNLRLLAWGLGLPLAIAIVALRTPLGGRLFMATNSLADTFLSFTQAGAGFVFGNWPAVTVVSQPVAGGSGTEQVVVGFVFAIKVLPILVFMASVTAILYHLRFLPWVVGILARGLSRAMGISGAEALSTIGDVFLGQTEAPLLVRPYIARMTESELFTLMTAGMATIAGTTLLAYSSMGIDAGVLVTASFMAAPAAVLLAKIMVPEKGTPETLLAPRPAPPEGAVPPGTAAGSAPPAGSSPPVAAPARRTVSVEVPRLSVNLIDAAARGAGEGLHLALNVGAMLVAFVALVHMADRGVGAVGGLFGHPEVRLATVLGWPLAPLAFVMGVPWSEAPTVGGLLGIKTALNEFLAYRELAAHVGAGSLSPQTIRIASFALCGFANFGSLAIVLGGLGTMVPERRPDIARLGLRSVLAGGLATCLVAAIAGLVAS